MVNIIKKTKKKLSTLFIKDILLIFLPTNCNIKLIYNCYTYIFYKKKILYNY